MKQGTLRTLKLLRTAVEFYNRPVCHEDLLNFSKESVKFSPFGIRRIKDDVRLLLIAGEIIKAGNNTGIGYGRFLYLPSNASISETEFLRMAAPAQIVEATFNELWNERVVKANAEGVLPKPVLTNDVYQRLRAKTHKFADKRTLPNTLLYLSGKAGVGIRKVKRPNEHFTAWVPASISDAEVNLDALYGSDSERIKVAVQRACFLYNRPVTSTEIMHEVVNERELTLTGKQSLSVQLNSSAKEKSYVKGKLVTLDYRNAVRRAGQYNGTAYYYYGKKKDEPKYSSYVSFLNLKLRWEQSNAEKQLEEIEGCRLPTVAAGRALLVAAQASKTYVELNKINVDTLPVEVKDTAEFLRQTVSKTINIAQEWIKSKNIQNLKLPSEVDAFTIGLTAEELLPLLKPFYPVAKKIKNASKLVTLFYKDIRRISNPDFKNRFGNNSKEASLFLFDKTDALLFIAHNWGGYESSLQANLAAAELGNLRDVRFVIPALNSKSFDERLSAIACLAFLQKEEGNTYLSKLKVEDSDPNIRQAAVWAHAFTQDPISNFLCE